MIKDIKENEFEGYRNEKKIVVQFWANWCGPCRMLKPIVDSIARKPEFQDIQFVRVNVDDAPNLSETFQIQSIPALYLMNEGEIIEAKIGFRTQEILEQEIRETMTYGGL